MANDKFTILCACGCETQFEWTRPANHPYRNPPRFVSGHNCRVMKTKRPSPPPPNPSGLCMCGCGKPVPFAKNNSGAFQVAGEFIRYLNGHFPKRPRGTVIDPADPRGPNPSGRCLCGCGETVGIATKNDPLKQNVLGCYVRFRRGHVHWKNRPNLSERTGICSCGCGQLTPIATRSARGNIKGQPMPYVDDGHAQRKAYKINEATGCWELNSHRADGYTRIRRGSLFMGHVWFYEQRFGPIPEGFELDHLCRNRACVNPDHLEPVTHEENMRRIRVASEIPTWGDWTEADIIKDAATGCHLFPVTQSDGYARFWMKKNLLMAHRFYYRRAKGQIAPGLQLDHTCRNRACVNPEHLEPVSNVENTRRAVQSRHAA